MEAARATTYEQQIDGERRRALWSLEQRNLYKLVTEVESGGAVIDRYETPFGIRTCKFDAEKGFFLNGKSVKLKGTCNHQDHAGVGAAASRRRAVSTASASCRRWAATALRTSHNPPTPELLDACDELGMLVFDETRMMSSNPEGLGAVREPGAPRPQSSQRLHVVAWATRKARPAPTRACSSSPR